MYLMFKFLNTYTRSIKTQVKKNINNSPIYQYRNTIQNQVLGYVDHEKSFSLINKLVNFCKLLFRIK